MQEIKYREGMSLDEFEAYFDQRIGIIDGYNKAIERSSKMINFLKLGGDE